VTRQEIEQKMDELARKYVETHDQKIIDELYELVWQLQEMEKKKEEVEARASASALGRLGFVLVKYPRLF
jgi:uncharacterized protein YcbK (DUF882 family)